MQDSIEDYIKISENKEDDLPTEQRRNEILITAQRKKECEVYSLKIVEFLIEGKLRPEAFLKCLGHINQELYQDVVDERMLTKLCGYPLCGKKLPEMPKKQYHISTKSNKIYNITERKKYCSNLCYNGSVYIKKQIETSPLWLRSPAEDPKFQLLPDTEKILPGELVTHAIAKEDIDQTFMSVTAFTECSLEEMGELEVNKKGKRKFGTQRHGYVKTMNTINETETNNENATEIIKEETDVSCNNEDVVEVKEMNAEDYQKQETFHQQNNSEESTKDIQNNPNLNLNHDILKFIEKINDLKYPVNKSPVKEIKNKLSNCKSFKSNDEKLKAIVAKCQAKDKKLHSIKLTDPLPIKQTIKLETELKYQTQPLNAEIPQSNQKEEEKLNETPKNLEFVKKSIKEWLTIDTCIFLHGYNKVKDTLTKNKLVEYFDTLKINERNTEQQLKYMTICKRLQLRDMAEEKFHKAAVGSKFKPLPDFQQLKEEGKNMNLKVRSFYDGSLYEKLDRNFPVKLKESKSMETTPLLPLNDWSSQNILRRKILLASANNNLRYHMNELNLNFSKILEDVQMLIKTLNLKADNIIFKPGQWDIVSIVFIKLLAIKNEEMSLYLHEEVRREYIKLVLDKVPSSHEFVENLVHFVYDIDCFVENYVASNNLCNV